MKYEDTHPLLSMPAPPREFTLRLPPILALRQSIFIIRFQLQKQLASSGFSIGRRRSKKCTGGNPGVSQSRLLRVCAGARLNAPVGQYLREMRVFIYIGGVVLLRKSKCISHRPGWARRRSCRETGGEREQSASKGGSFQGIKGEKARLLDNRVSRRSGPIGTADWRC